MSMPYGYRPPTAPATPGSGCVGYCSPVCCTAPPDAHRPVHADHLKHLLAGGWTPPTTRYKSNKANTVVAA